MSLFSIKISLPIVFFSITILCVYYVCEQYFSLGNYFVLPALTIVFSFLSLLVHLKRTGKYPNRNNEVIFLLIYLYLSVLLYGYYSFDIVAAYSLIFVLFYFVTIRDYNIGEIRFLLICYILSAVILSVLLFLQLKMPYWGRIRFTVFFSNTEFYDANFLGSYLLLPTLFSFYFSWISPLKNKALLCVCICVNIILLAAILATGSRAAMLGLLIGTSPILLDVVKKKRLIVIIAVVIIIIYTYLPQELLERLFFNSYDDGSQSRRTDDWMYGLMAVGKSPILGCGFSSTSTVIYRFFHVNITAHNSFIAMLINWGFLGSVPFLILLLKPLWRHRNCFLNTYLFSFYCAFIFNIAIIEAITSFVFIIPFIVFTIITQNKCVQI